MDRIFRQAGEVLRWRQKWVERGSLKGGLYGMVREENKIGRDTGGLGTPLE